MAALLRRQLKFLSLWQMIEKIERVETRFADLDRVVSDMMGQILLLIQGVYIKKGKRVPDLKQEVPSG
jgi:uncharacterized protein (UPF0335 family)